MKKILATAAVVALLAGPVAAGTTSDVKDYLTDAGGAIDNAIQGSWMETFFESAFGLTYLGDFWIGLCADVGGEWVDNECVGDLFR